MPRATTRNKGLAHSQRSDNSQFVSGTDRRDIANARDDDSEEGEDAEMDTIEEEAQSIERRAADLVRLALFTEYRRITLRREDITKKVFGGRIAKGEFDSVFQCAQTTLRKTFGMELHEILSRAERLKVDAVRDGMGYDAETTIGPLKKKGSIASSKQYILRSVLDSTIIQNASQRNNEIEESERKEKRDWSIGEDEHQLEGTILAWRCGGNDQLTSAGILHVILALILVNGRVLNDMQLKTYLKRVRLPLGTPMPSGMDLHAGKPFTIEAYLVQLARQSYLERHVISVPGTQGGQKRPRSGGGGTIGTDDSDGNYEWRWGTRSISEISEEGICGFIADFMEGVERERENRRIDEGEELGNDGDGGSANRREKLTLAIGRAAGGGLTAYR